MNIDERVRFIEHSGVKVLLIDASKLKDKNEIMAIIQQTEKIVEEQQDKSLLTLTDATDTHFDDSILKALKRTTKHNAPYIKASANVGVTGLKKALLPLVAIYSGRVMKAFNTRSEALDWLVGQADS